MRTSASTTTTMQSGSRPSIGVGELAGRCGTTVRTVRYYDRVGLVVPDHVDPVSGRRYRPEQVGDLATAVALRRLDVPLAEVRASLSLAGAARQQAVEAVLARHRTRLEARQTRVQRQLHDLDHALSGGLPDPSPAAEDPPPQAATVPRPATVAATVPQDVHRRLAVACFNATWELMAVEDRSPQDDDRLVHLAHASAHHWQQVGDAANRARAEWLCSRVYAVLGRAEPAGHHARRALDICEDEGLVDWDLGFAYEAVARAAALAGDGAAVDWARSEALRVAATVAEDRDRDLLLQDLATVFEPPRPSGH